MCIYYTYEIRFKTSKTAIFAVSARIIPYFFLSRLVSNDLAKDRASPGKIPGDVYQQKSDHNAMFSIALGRI